jgi:hypothetical protein
MYQDSGRTLKGIYTVFRLEKANRWKQKWKKKKTCEIYTRKYPLRTSRRVFFFLLTGRYLHFPIRSKKLSIKLQRSTLEWRQSNKGFLFSAWEKGWWSPSGSGCFTLKDDEHSLQIQEEKAPTKFEMRSENERSEHFSGHPQSFMPATNWHVRDVSTFFTTWGEIPG